MKKSSYHTPAKQHVGQEGTKTQRKRDKVRDYAKPQRSQRKTEIFSHRFTQIKDRTERSMRHEGKEKISTVEITKEIRNKYKDK